MAANSHKDTPLYRRWTTLVCVLLVASSGSRLFGQVTSRIVDGVIVVQDDGSYLLGDRPLAIQSLSSIQLKPNSRGSFDAASVPFVWSAQGSLAVDRAGSSDWVSVSLPFTFPLGGVGYSALLLHRDGGVFFASPPATSLQYSSGLARQFELSDAVTDSSPRLLPLWTPPLNHGGLILSGQYTSAYSSVSSAQAVFTWLGAGYEATGFQPVEFQMQLTPEGTVRFNYRDLRGTRQGSVVAVTGRETWWNSGRLLASAGDVNTATAGSILSATCLQLGSSNVVQIRYQFNLPLPQLKQVSVGVEFRDSSQQLRGTVTAALTANAWSELFVAKKGSASVTNLPILKNLNVQIDGQTVSFNAPLDGIVPVDGALTARFVVSGDINYSSNSTTIPLSWTNIQAAVSQTLPLSPNSPLFDVYTIPFVNPDIVKLVQPLVSGRAEGFVVFPTEQTSDWGGSSGGRIADGLGISVSIPFNDTPQLVMRSAVPLDPTDPAHLFFISHDFGHRWLYYPKIAENGQPTSSLLESSGIHPSYYTQTAAAFPVLSAWDYSPMNGSAWLDNGNGTFTDARSISKQTFGLAYSWLELYLMGLACPAEVPEWYYLQNPSSIPNSSAIRATKVPVNIGQVIAANGPRSPACDSANRSFLVPFVLLLPAGQNATAEQVAKVRVIRTAWKNAFVKSTGGRASVSVNPLTPASVGTPVSLDAAIGNNQSGPPGTQLPTPLVATARDQAGAPVPGASVSWTLRNGVGSLSSAAALTDSEGNVISFFTPGLAPTSIVRAALTSNPEVFVDFNLSVSYPSSVTPAFAVSTFAGTGVAGFSGDGGPAASAQLSTPFGVAADAQGNIFVADQANQRIRRIAPDGRISTFAGGGSPGQAGEGGPALSAQLSYPSAVATDGSGNVLVADRGRILQISPAGTLTRVASNTFASQGVVRDVKGNVIASGSAKIFQYSPNGTSTVIAGTGTQGNTGDEGPANAATLNLPGGIAFDTMGNLFVADLSNFNIREITLDGIIHTFASQLDDPQAIVFDGQGFAYLTQYSGEVLQLSPDGTRTSLVDSAGAGAKLNEPVGVTIDSSGNLFVADSGNNRVVKFLRVNRVPASLSIAPGVSLNGISGASVPFKVSVRTADGYQVSNVAVNFALQNGTASPGSAFTGTDGIAATAVTLGAGNVAVRVTLPDFPAVAAVTATGVASSGAPQVSAVLDAAGARASIVAGEWVGIYGNNLSTTTRTWALGDFSGTTLPLALDGVSVTFNGLRGAVFFVSPSQINVQVPSGIVGNVMVTVSNNGRASAAFNVIAGDGAASLFAYSAGTKQYAASIHTDGTLIGDPSITGSQVRKAQPGETIALYANGLGPSPAGTIVLIPAVFPDVVTATVGGESARVSFAGLVASGEFQINLTVPLDLSSGDYPVLVQTRGQSSQQGVLLPVER